MVRVRLAVGLLLVSPSLALAQSQRAIEVRASHHDVSPPLRDMPPIPWRLGEFEAEPAKPIPSRRQPPVGPDQVVQGKRFAPVAGQAPATALNRDGIGSGFSGPQGGFSVRYAPPDNNGAVGTTQFVETVNVALAVFNKSTGAVQYGPVNINTLWSGFAGGCATNNDGDPTVVFDHLANRWVISQFSVSSLPYTQCVAVSTSADATGSYYRYAFQYDNIAFNDYPKMGVWPDGYYVTYNIFNNAQTFAGSKICAFDRAKMLTGASATQQCVSTSTAFGGLLPADLDGSTLPPAGAPNYLVALGATSSQLAVWKFHVDWTNSANSTFSSAIPITVSSYAEACGGGTCIPQPSTGTRLDSLADRLMYRAAYRRFSDHEALVVSHAVTAGSTVGVRWYELRNLSGTPAVFQQSTFAPDATYRWMPSIAMDKQGNIALGYSASSSAVRPEVRYTGRLAGDALNTMTQGESTIVTGLGSQTQNLTRWGDYTSMSVDPVDDCTFWYTNQYLPASGSFNWRTRLAAFKFPGCGTTSSPDFSLSASPLSATVTQGTAAGYTVAVSPVNGYNGLVDLAVTSGLPAGATATFTPNPASTTSSLSVTTTGVAAGTYTLAITGTDTANSSLTHTTNVTLTVQSAAQGQLTLTATPASRSVNRGSPATYTITITRSGGFTGAVSLSASGVPSRTTASFSPNGTTGNTSTFTISTAKNSVRGTFTVTITGTGSGVANATTSVQVTIN
jgi:hypothetical protein